MKILLSVLPIALLVAYSQIIVKWRAAYVNFNLLGNDSYFRQVKNLISDPYLMSAYAAALLASFAWLVVVSRLPLVVAFPIYIGVTFVLVMVGGWCFLNETISGLRLLAAALILAGIAIGVKG